MQGIHFAEDVLSEQLVGLAAVGSRRCLFGP